MDDIYQGRGEEASAEDLFSKGRGGRLQRTLFQGEDSWIPFSKGSYS